jgi:hypothetical protein
MLACGPAADIRVVAHKLWQSSGHVIEHGDDLLDAAMRADGLVIFEEPMTLGLLQVSWAPRSHDHARRTVQCAEHELCASKAVTALTGHPRGLGGGSGNGTGKALER